MVNRLNETATEFEIDDGEKMVLEFSRIPSTLEVEVSDLGPEVTKAGLKRYISALPCSPLLEDIVKHPEKDAFFVKFRTVSGRQC